MLRHIVNFFITGFLMLAFEWIGWINLAQDLNVFGGEFANKLLAACIVGLIFSIGIWLASLLFGLFVAFTCGLGCLLLPVYLALLGTFGLVAVSNLIPGWIELSTSNFWVTALMGILVAVIRIPLVNTSSSSN